MKKAILARKVGMTQIYNEEGRVVPVTVLKAGPCKVVQQKAEEKEGYQAVQVGFEELNPGKANRPLQGHFKKWGVSPFRFLKEFRLEEAGQYQPGDEIKADLFNAGDMVDVSALSKGKGFAGSVKRHRQSTGPKTRGSHYHRGPGSLGNMDSSRVFKGRPLPGRMGGKKTTVMNLQVVEADAEKNLLMVRGAVPGPRGGLVEVRNAAKAAQSG